MLQELKILNIINSEEIRKINKKYRKIDKATDVLSFPMFEKEELEQKIAVSKNPKKSG